MKNGASLKKTRIKGKNAGKAKIGIVFSRYNEKIGRKMLDSTLKTLGNQGVAEKHITVIEVPGALEIPLAAKLLIDKHRYSAIITLGIVIKGETLHFEIVSKESHRALMDLGLKKNIPVIFGIICANTLKQAEERTSPSKLDKGREFALAALDMISTVDSLI